MAWLPLTSTTVEPARTKTGSALQKIQEPSFENRRLRSRVSLNTDVTCAVGDRVLNGLIWNISQGGIQLEVASLELGDMVRISFILPQPAAVIKAEGVVVWAQGGWQGLYFSEMSVENQEMVRPMCYAARIALTYLKLASPVFTILMAGVWHVLKEIGSRRLPTW
jgi:hypothetical protein